MKKNIVTSEEEIAQKYDTKIKKIKDEKRRVLAELALKKEKEKAEKAYIILESLETITGPITFDNIHIIKDYIDERKVELSGLLDEETKRVQETEEKEIIPDLNIQDLSL